MSQPASQPTTLARLVGFVLAWVFLFGAWSVLARCAKQEDPLLRWLVDNTPRCWLATTQSPTKILFAETDFLLALGDWLPCWRSARPVGDLGLMLTTGCRVGDWFAVLAIGSRVGDWLYCWRGYNTARGIRVPRSHMVPCTPGSHVGHRDWPPCWRLAPVLATGSRVGDRAPRVCWKKHMSFVVDWISVVDWLVGEWLGVVDRNFWLA